MSTLELAEHVLNSGAWATLGFLLGRYVTCHHPRTHRRRDREGR